MAHVSTSNSQGDGGSPVESDAIISLRGIQKRYGRKQILDIPEFDIRRSDRIELIGANASGKSTLARLIAGYAKPNRGHILRSAELKTARIGLLRQTGGLYRDLTLMQNIVMIARLFGRRDAITPHSERVISALEIGPYLDRKSGTLSGGLQRLSALAALISARPAALILDEPFAGLDETKVELVRSVLNSDHPKFQFVVVTGHTPQSIFPSSRVVNISEGKVVGTQGRTKS